MNTGGPAGTAKCRWRRALLTAALMVAFSLEAAMAVGQSASLPQTAEPLLADVDLDDVSAEAALRFLAELYDVSLATGQLPDSRVTLRLRGVSADEAFGSVAAAAGLDVERRGSVMLVSPRARTGEAGRIVFGPFPWAPRLGLDWLAAAGVEAALIGDDAVLLEGSEARVAAVVAALEEARRGAVVERVFPLGAAPGEETREAVQSLLEPEFESASYDPTGHLLTVSALPSTLDRVEVLLGELTHSPAQFEIEVRVVEVSRNALKRIGAQGFFRLEVRGGALVSTYPLEGVDDSARYFPSPTDLATLANLASFGGNLSAVAEPGSLQEAGFRFGRVDARGTGLLIEFLEQTGEARVMATPSVTALDNRQALISMVTTLRIPTFTQNAAFATTTVTGIEEIDVGTTLEVRPRRATASEILLTVVPEVSELVGTLPSFSQGGLTQNLPIVTRRRTETEVILEAGETLVIGGLVSEREIEVLGETPGLAKIPILGRAFRHKSTESESSELLVFVTPHLLPPPEQRHAKVRVDDRWIPAEIAARIQAARGLLVESTPAARAAGVGALEQIDGEVLELGLDVGHDVVRLAADRDLGVRVAAALFLLHRRPETALGELVRFADSRTVALSAVAASMAPHLRAALAELIGRSPGGIELLVSQLEEAVDAKDRFAASNLLEALSVAAPERAAQMATALADRADGVLIERQRIDALSGATGSESELAALAMNGDSEETRAFAVGALARSLARQNRAELIKGQFELAGDEALQRRLRGLERTLIAPRMTEPALGWTGKPGDIEIANDRSDADLIRAALDLLAEKAPDLRQMVGFALARIEAGAAGSSVDPVSRTAWIATAEVEADQLALRMVRLATIVFESRVRGFPATGDRALARAVRQEIHALERLTGAPCSTQCADSTVLHVLRSEAVRRQDGV